MSNTHTIAVSFHDIPADDANLFAVCSGISAMHAQAAANIMLTFVRDRMVQAVAGDLETDECWIHAFLIEAAMTLQKALEE